jgi:hypothetical protein
MTRFMHLLHIPPTNLQILRDIAQTYAKHGVGALVRSLNQNRFRR